MDSGAVSDTEDVQPPFDLMTPLLPEEVCWVLDQALACEVRGAVMSGVHPARDLIHVLSDAVA